MKYALFSLFVLLSISQVFGQVSVDQTNIDFGLIERGSNRLVDLTFTNHGEKEAVFLHSNFDENYDLLYSRRVIPADSSMVLRLQFNPRQKGAYDHDVAVFFGSQPAPILLHFEAEVAYIDVSENPRCPSFNQLNRACCPDEPCLVRVWDAKDKTPIEGATCQVWEQGQLLMASNTNDEGKLFLELPIGYYQLKVEIDNYEGQTLTSYVNRHNNDFDVFLHALPEELALSQGLVLVPVAPLKEEAMPAATLDSTEFSAGLYARNNIVFLVDVSQSMNQGDKMELMKSAMLSLVDMLREIDQITVVTYAREAYLAVACQPVTNKAMLKLWIEDIEAGGSTAGAKGFNMAYKEAQKARLPGNNQVIVVTDGAFSSSDGHMVEKLVRKYSRKNIYTTVLSIQGSPGANRILAELSVLGQGAFLSVADEADADNMLIAEIKKQSRLN